MKKILLVALALICATTATQAGDYLTNTNQHAAFVRNLARGAAIDYDGVYSNPAGLAFLKDDGFHLSLTIQSAFQTRDIAATSPLWTLDGQTTTRQYKGKASAPVIPSFHATYKKDNWALSAGFAITGGGGKASFSQGLPMFDAAAIGLVASKTSPANLPLPGLQRPLVMPSMYNINSAMEGRQYVYGFQMGLSYAFNEHLSVFGGARMNYFSGGYTGFLELEMKENAPALMVQNYAAQLMAAGMPEAQALTTAQQGVGMVAPALDSELAASRIALDCDQTGWGLSPIIGIDAKFGKLNLAAKYEFRANMNIENDTKQFERPEAADAAMAPYKDGVNTPSDIPSMLSVAAAYEILPTLRASVEYHFFDDKSAGMAGGKNKELSHGTHEFLAGAEWDVTPRLTLSGGFQRTDYGLTDGFQTDTSFSCDSYTIGFGGRIHFSERLSLDVAYMWTNYEDYKCDTPRKAIGQAMGQTYNTTNDFNTYSRSNKVFGVSANYRF